MLRTGNNYHCSWKLVLGSLVYFSVFADVADMLFPQDNLIRPSKPLNGPSSQLNAHDRICWQYLQVDGKLFDLKEMQAVLRTRNIVAVVVVVVVGAVY